MGRVFLVDLDEKTAPDRAELLRAAGHEVDFRTGEYKPAWLKAVDALQPEAAVIALDRLPSHGRSIAAMLAQRKATRTTPFVFAGGAPDKVAATKKAFPEAIYSEWRGVAAAVRKALRQKVQVHPKFTIETDRPLAQKLGIKEGSRVVTFNAPDSFERTLGALPEGASMEEDARGAADVAILFCDSEADLAHGFARLVAAARDSRRLWIAWPKKTSGRRTDMTMDIVRTYLLARGWVDYKVCAIDATWTALLAALKKPVRT